MEFVVRPSFDPITDVQDIALLEDNGLSFGGGARTILEDTDGNMFDENMNSIEIQEELKWNVLLVMTVWTVSMI